MYFHDSRLLLLHPTKTGGSTVEHHLMQTLKDSVTPHVYSTLQYLNDDGYDERHELKTQIMFGNYKDAQFPKFSLQHACLTTARRLLGDEVFNGARKVAIVRNPYRRFVSQFFDYGFSNSSTLATFVRKRLPLFAGEASKVAINFAAKQTLYTHRDGACAVDLVLRLEQMEEGFEKLSEFLGVPIQYEPQTRLRKSKASQAFENYMDAYDEDSLAIVRELYADDFALLGYDPDVPAAGLKTVTSHAPR